MRKNVTYSVIVPFFAVALISASTCVSAALTAKELSELGGAKYTPLGAIRAGNKEGTIPAWVDKPPVQPADKKNDQWADPFANEKPLFTITPQNYEQYKDKLLPGQIAMFKRYPQTFRMHIYPTHRTAVYEPWVYEATKRQAEKVTLHPDQLTKGVVGLKDFVPGGGVPFPFPKNADEVEWNHELAPMQFQVKGLTFSVLMDPAGNRVDVAFDNRETRPWWIKKEDVDKYPLFKQQGLKAVCPSMQTLIPARSAGLLNGGCIGIDPHALNTYLYLPGQRRVRRAPEIGVHDSPSFGSDGLRTMAGWNMGYFGGEDSRHNRKIVGLKEAYVPYNTGKLSEDSVTANQLFGSKHINSDLIRYELHRVWEIEAVRKPGIRHLYKRQVSYYDEDSWLGLAMEVYDDGDNLWRVGEQYYQYNFHTKTLVPYGDAQLDLINGRYVTFYWWYKIGQKELGRSYEISFDSSVPLFNVEDFYTPQGLRNSGMR